MRHYKHISIMTSRKACNFLLLMLIYIAISSSLCHCDCSCSCFEHRAETICETVEDLRMEVDANVEELKKWAKFYPFVQRLRDKLKEDIIEIVAEEIKKYHSGEVLPKPEKLTRHEDDIQNDYALITKPPEENNELAKNVSTLLIKVEMVENKTKEVEEELKSERRVRRHLEQEVNETRSSLLSLGDQIQNVSSPLDAIRSEVYTVMFASLQDMNRTLYEDHLQKLYYRVEGVVYQNETRKLDERLEVVETELHENVTAASRLVEDVGSMKRSLFAINETVSSVIPRISVLENDTLTKDAGLEIRKEIGKLYNETDTYREKLEKVETELEEKIEDLSNATQINREKLDLSVTELGSKVENLFNKTEMYKRKLENAETEKENRIENLLLMTETNRRKLELSENSYENKLESLRNITEKYRERLDNTELLIESKFEGLFNKSEAYLQQLEEVKNNVQDLKNFEEKFTNLSKEWSETLQSMQLEVQELKNSPTTVESTVSAETTLPTASQDDDVAGIYENYISDEYGWNYENNFEKNRITRTGGDSEDNSCDIPLLDDDHLLTFIDENEEKKQTLLSGCQPIGKYAIEAPPVPILCENGEWKGPLPKCKKLLSEYEIDDMAQALEYENPCGFRSDGLLPDPTNCSRFFSCSYAMTTVRECPDNMHFNSELQVCDYIGTTNCHIVINPLYEELQELVPTILVDPPNLDKPSGLLGTGKAGELIVHPRTTFTLHCLYPYSAWGMPKWVISYFNTSKRSSLPLVRGNDVGLTVTAATEDDSGDYVCQTPFGKVHKVAVHVKAVQCPSFTAEDNPTDDIFYRPTPEGEYRILGTTAEFYCEEGHKITTVCQADGKWSRGYPNPEECTVKKKKLKGEWNCPALDTSSNPYLVLERSEEEKIIKFRCVGRLELRGNAFTRCRDDGLWSHVSLPKCYLP